MSHAAELCIPEWRFGRSFTPEELELRLRGLRDCPLSAPESDEAAASDPAFLHYYSQAVIGIEQPGPPEPGGLFERARELIRNYEFSDPRIVTGYFDPDLPLLQRPMLLEIRVLQIRYLCGVLVRAVREESRARESIFGYRYDTLEGHIEAGAEWFLLTKKHDTGAVQFRIQAAWREGQLPNWWSHLGFKLLCRPYQRAWHRLAYLRLRRMLEAQDLPPLPRFGRLMKEGRPVAAPPVVVLAGANTPRDVQAESQN